MMSTSDSCDYVLDQSSFTDGTYRITTSGKYCLSEDIVFNPNPTDISNPNDPFSSSFPSNSSTYPGCTDLSGGAYALGFFAAITIETDDVELDLQNYEIKMDFTFYIQQRFFAIIEIGNAPFNTGSGPIDFGANNAVSGINIHDGIIGLSSHFGIHSNDANDVSIENVRIYDFEVAGIQMNQFNGLTLNNLKIGPSSTTVLPGGYYSSAKYLSYALYNVLHDNALSSNTSITFAGDRVITLQQIYDDLITSLDIAFRSFLSETTDEDITNELYDTSISLYSNPMALPDGAVLSGISLNGDSETLKATNIMITDLTLNTNEIPAVSMTPCDELEILKGAFGDVLDIRTMVGSWDNALIIDLGDDYTSLTYVGNPLSDAQIAYGLFTNSTLSETFLQWALNEYASVSYDGIPQCYEICTQFVCNHDIMFQSNIGIIGFRFNDIYNAQIENVVIKRLINKSPLQSYVCANYSGDNGLGTDTKGMSVCGGDVVFDGFNNVIEKLVSYNGDVVGLDLNRDATVTFDYVFGDEVPQTEDDIDTEDDRSALHINQLCPGHEITFALLAELMVDGQYPYPNNFYACNVLVNDGEDGASITPNPPNGVDKVWCADYVPQNVDDTIANVLSVVIIGEDSSDESDESDDNSDEDTVSIDTSTTESAQSTNNTFSESELTSNSSATEAGSGSGSGSAAQSIEDKINNYIFRIKNDGSDVDILDKYPAAPYVYFFVGLMCIIMVVFVLVTFIMKCGKMMMNSNKSYYKANKYIDDDLDDSSDTMDEDEDNAMGQHHI